jgi:hypothetical protein
VLDRESQLRQKVRNALEERESEDRHEPDLTGGELVDVSQLRWTTKQRSFHAYLALHLSLIGKFFL